MSGPEIVTFGCRLNAYESEVIRGHETVAGRDDVVVVNTCAVTLEAERQARQTIRKLRRERPGAEIVVTGCAAQIAPETWAAMPEVSRVVGNHEKLQAPSFLPGRNEPVLVDDIMTVRETAGHLLEGFDGRARAFLQVQNGCDHRCTFCIIPYGRGPSRSAPVGQVVAEARALAAEGVAEIVLTGVDITSYGPDLPGQPTLGQLCRRLLAGVSDLKRLRISSIDPVEVDDDLWRLIAEEPRLMPHLHLSLQAGDDLILKRMKRRHSRADAIRFCDRARALRPDMVFGADLIAGFPTESEAMFQNSLDLIADCGLTWLHIFPYSERPGTPAALMPPVNKALRKERAARLRAAGAQAARHHLEAQIGGTVEVLVERDRRGHSAHFASVELSEEIAPGSLVRARGAGVRGETLLAEARVMADGERKGWFGRLKAGLSKSAGQLTQNISTLFTKRKLDDAALEDLEDVLIRADLGVATAARITQAIAESRYDKEVTDEELREALAAEVAALLVPVAAPLTVDPAAKPHVVLVAGVNGVGKTTTIGKIARHEAARGHKVMLCAGDTFRAAAIEQLKIWGERTGAQVIARDQGADAAGLAFDALQAAKADGADLLLIDTAGRLQNKANLMAELEKIVRVLKKLDPAAPHSVLLVLDATTGQNAVNQVEVFRDVCNVTGLVMTKLDGSARGGVLVAVADRFGLPVHYIGVGEQAEDLKPFDARDFARALCGLEN